MSATAEAVRVHLQGVGVGSGSAVGVVVRVSPPPALPDDDGAPVAPEAGVTRLTQVMAEIGDELERRSTGAEGQLRDILAATALMARDPALLAAATGHVEGGLSPARAIDRAVGDIAVAFEAAGGYLAERASDLHSVRHLAVARLTGVPDPGIPAMTGPSVVIAADLAPADTAMLDLAHTVALVTEGGGPTSHTAIIAGQLGLPCVVGVSGVLEVAAGIEVAVDAASGTVIVGPDAGTKDRLEVRARALALLADDRAPGATADGHRVALLANIGTVADAERAAATAVEGVGLFRTEVLFLDARTAPTVDEQTATYARVLEAFGDRKVVVRTLDAGADKPLAFAHQDAEENPALGVRGFRLVRTLPQLLTDQLTALGRAREATGRAPWVMAPMVATAAEAAQFAALAHAAGVATVGVMVEVPAVALRADRVLGEVDFVSIGTNDLAQYTMASDRLSAALSDLIDRWQPAVLDLVAATARAGQAAGKPVGVCGESAADPLMALVLTGLGITSLSMSPSAVPLVRLAVRTHSLATCQAMAQAALAADTPDHARRAVVGLLDTEARAVLLDPA